MPAMLDPDRWRKIDGCCSAAPARPWFDIQPIVPSDRSMLRVNLNGKSNQPDIGRKPLGPGWRRPVPEDRGA